MAYEDLMGALINSESSGNPNARNSKSSAGGLGQFIDSTWLDMVSRYRPDIAEGKTREQILQLKFNPELSREMTGHYAEENGKYLQARGIEPTAGAIKLSHFAGPAGAAAIYSDPGKTVEALLGSKAVQANPFLRGKTGADAIAWAEGVMSPGKSMARTIAQRYGGGKSGEENAPLEAPAVASQARMAAGQGNDTVAGGSGLDRLKAALSGTGTGYDADALAQSEKLIADAQKISGAGNLAGTIGGPILAGIGAYQRDQLKEAKKADEAGTLKALTDGVNVPPVISALLKSSNPDYKAAGMDALLKMQAQASTRTDAYGEPVASPLSSPAPQPSAPVDQAGAPRMHVSPANPVLSAQEVANYGQPQPMPAMSNDQAQAYMAGMVDPATGADRQVPPQTAQTSAAPPVSAPIPVAAPAPEPQQQQFVVRREPVHKFPEGYVQRTSPDGGFLYAQDGRTPILESKAEAETRAKLGEKRADTQREAEQQIGGVSGIIGDARKLSQTPGFDNALKLGRTSLELGLPTPLGTIGGDVASPVKQIARMIDPQNPAWGVADEIGATQNRLNLLVARPLMKGQGQVSDSERKMVSDAIGGLAKASNKADYQFRLNSVQRMIEDMNSTGKVKPAADYAAKPTTAEIQGLIDRGKGTFSTAGLQKLAEKYNVEPIDMQQYVNELFLQSMGAK